MKLTVLGASGTYPRPGGACNSYLVSEGKAAALLDIGPGSLSNLFRWPEHEIVKVLLLSHLHPDHLSDIFSYRYYLQFSAAKSRLPVTVLAPTGARERILSFSADPDVTAFDEVFNFVEAAAGETYVFGALTIEPFEAKHMGVTFAARVSGGNGVIYYSSDTGWDERLAVHARGADLLICEATLRQSDEDKGIAHLSGRQAGLLAEKAGVGRLVLSHLWAHYDSPQILASAQAVCRAPVELAREGAVYTVGE